MCMCVWGGRQGDILTARNTDVDIDRQDTVMQLDTSDHITDLITDIITLHLPHCRRITTNLTAGLNINLTTDLMSIISCLY